MFIRLANGPLRDLIIEKTMMEEFKKCLNIKNQSLSGIKINLNDYLVNVLNNLTWWYVIASEAISF